MRRSIVLETDRGEIGWMGPDDFTARWSKLPTCWKYPPLLIKLMASLVNPTAGKCAASRAFDGRCRQLAPVDGPSL